MHLRQGLATQTLSSLLLSLGKTQREAPSKNMILFSDEPQNPSEEGKMLKKKEFLCHREKARNPQKACKRRSGELLICHIAVVAFGSGVVPANQTKERWVHELFAGANLNHSDVNCACFPRTST